MIEEIFNQVKKMIPDIEHEKMRVMFEKFGEDLCVQVGSTFLYAGKERIDDAILRLEKYYDSDLKYQHPEIRGAHPSNLIFFAELCQNYADKQNFFSCMMEN